MQDTLTNWLSGFAAQRDRWALFQTLGYIADRMSSQATSSAGLVIKAGGSALAKTGSAVTTLVANGVPLQIAASTDMPALTGIDIDENDFNIVCFFVNSGGTVVAAAGTAAGTLAAVQWPPFPQGEALIGYLSIEATGTAFTGGTTALDAVTTLYSSPTGAFDPSVLVGTTL